MNELSTAQMSAAVFAAVFGFVNKYPAIGVAFGIVWLTLVATWPKWKPVWLRLPKTTHERLKAVETEHIPRITKTLDAASEAVTSHAVLIASTSASVEAYGNRIGTVETRVNAIQEFIGDKPPLDFLQLCLLVDLNGEKASNWFNGLGDRISKIEQLLVALEKRFTKTVPAIICLSQLLMLIREVDYCIDRYLFLRDSYPRGVVALSPLDRSWRTIGGEQDYGTKLAIDWAEVLELHVHRANGFFSTPGKRAFGDDTVLLYTYAAMKKSFPEITAKQFEDILGKHRTRLREMRDAYAATCLDAS